MLLLAYAAFVSLGLPDTVLGVAWPSIRESFGVSQAAFGMLPAVGVAGYFSSGILVGPALSRVSLGSLLAASTMVVAAGLLVFAATPMWLLFVPAAFLLGAGSGAIDSALNGYAAHNFSVRHMNWLHACWGLGATIGPGIMTAALTRTHSYRPGYAIIASVLSLMGFAFVATRARWNADSPHGAARQSTAVAPAESAVGLLSTLRSRAVLLQIAIFFVYTGLEASAGQWAFTVLREARDFPVMAAGTWTAAYWGCLLAGRIVLGFFVERVGADRMLRLATAGAAAGAFMYAASDGDFGLLGLAILGACLAPVFPTLMSRSPARLGASANYAIGLQLGAASLSTAAVPGALGVLATSAGVQVIPSLLAALALLLLVLHELLLRISPRAAAQRE